MVPSWPVKPGPNFADFPNFANFMLKNPLPAAGAAVAEAAAAVEEWSEGENVLCISVHYVHNITTIML